MNSLISFVKNLYTLLIKSKFQHFGKNSTIQPVLNSHNEQYISIGDSCNIGAFCRLTVATEFGGHKVKSKRKVRLQLGDFVDIGSNTFISCNNHIEIGSHVIMSTNIFITDHDHGIENVHLNLHEQPLSEGGYVIIKDNVFIGTKVSILKNVTIGEHSSIGANSLVNKDVPPYTIVAGNPARVIKKYSHKLNKWLKV